MTNEKAIRVLEHIEYYLKTHTNESCEEEHTALDLAIKALEEKTQGDLISREALKKALKTERENIQPLSDTNYHVGVKQGLKLAETVIDNAPTVDINTELSVAYLKGRMQGQSDERPQGEVEITNEDIQNAIKAGFNEGYEMAKGKFIQLLEKWADGYCYIEILTEDAIKAVEGMGGKDNV